MPPSLFLQEGSKMSNKIRLVLTVFILLGLLMPNPVSAARPAHVADPSPAVFINEIHYDNTGGDTGEAVEIAGPAGDTLNEWTLLLYNGSDGAVYNTISLSGNFPDQQNGYGTLSFATTGLQNGPPDGLALVDRNSVVQMFLSYEGEFIAVGNKADGLLSTNIGVEEGGSTPVGYSLQLTGSGTSYAEFTWATEQAATFGALNTGQTFGEGSSNEPVSINCGATLTLNEGSGGSATVIANDPDGMVVDIAITAVTPQALITLSDLVVAGEAGQEASALINVDASVPAGTYVVSLSAANNDAEPQTATCDLTVEVQAVVLNQPVEMACPAPVSLVVGESATTTISASDLDGVVTDIAITAVTPTAPITLSDLVPAGDVGQTASALISVDTSTPAGTYLVSLTATNNDAEPQTATCDLTVQVLEIPVLADVYISEIHYDNTGADAGEMIEVAGPAGTDLTGWSIVLYNGNGGASYLPLVSLSGTLPDQKAGMGTLAFPAVGLQNGAPDGLALVFTSETTTTVVEFLSYEGTFMATNGPATGMSSVDIGVSEPDNTATGLSLQLINGVWVGPMDDSFGEINHLAISDLVINEIDYDQPSTDTAEFIELRNNGSTAAPLLGWIVEIINGASGGAGVAYTITLPDAELAAGETYVICANAATVANCDLDVAKDTDLIQNGAPDAVGLLYDGEVIDAVSYEGDSGAPYLEGSGVGLVDTAGEGEGISRCPNGSDTDQNNLDFVLADITPGAENSCAPAEVCGDPFTPIYTIQGNGIASPLVDTEVTVEGVVTADFQLDSQLKGFYLQDATGDGNALTSDGILIYQPASSGDVNVGDHVRLRGTVAEYYEMTEIKSVSMQMTCSSENTITPTPISLPLTAISDYEAYEGMLLTFPQTLYFVEYYNFDQYGEIVLATGRQYTSTAMYEPGSPEAAQLTQNNLLNRITLDDGRTSQNPDPAMHPNGAIFDLANRFRGGDELHNVTGVLDYNYSAYKLHLTVGAEYITANPRTDLPEDTGGNITVASFNVLNYFTTLDSRGANTADEFERQRAKIIDAISKINADVVGLIEIENNSEAIVNLVDGLNTIMGSGTYAYLNTGVIGTDEIKVAFIYKPATVSLLGNYAILDSTVDARFLDTKNRPALAQTFQTTASGGIFTVVVNHLKSKGSDCLDIGDPDLGDGAGNCNLTRKAAAEALVDWLATNPTGSGNANYLIIGDLNSYDKEDPIDAIKLGSDDLAGSADDYSDLLYTFIGEVAYSYVYDGQLGYLDHALASSALLPRISGVTVWHINSDEPDLIDYDMTYKKDAQDLLYEPNAYRSSDHDPVIIGFNICDEIAPTLEVSVAPNKLWPPNHKMVTIHATVSVADNFDANPTVTLLSVTSSQPDFGPSDIEIIDDTTIRLRAENTGYAKSRVYTITYQAADSCGNVTTQSVTVKVPKNWQWPNPHYNYPYWPRFPWGW
jgi:uncharacterized protein